MDDSFVFFFLILQSFSKVENYGEEEERDRNGIVVTK